MYLHHRHHKHHHKTEKLNGNDEFKLSVIVKLCLPLIEFIEIDRERNIDQIYRVLDSGSRLNALLQRLMNAYVHSGIEVQYDIKITPRSKSVMIRELFILKGDQLIDHLHLLLAAVAMKIVELPDEQLDALQKMTEDRRQEADSKLFDDIQRDWNKSEIKITKLLKADQSHHAHKTRIKQHSLFCPPSAPVELRRDKAVKLTKP